jgi:hypothetical protein
MNGVTKSSTKARHVSRIILCSSDKPRSIECIMVLPPLFTLKDAGQMSLPYFDRIERVPGRSTTTQRYP